MWKSHRSTDRKIQSLGPRDAGVPSPGPVATELDCTVVIPVSELYRTSKTSRLNTWKATVRLPSGTGGLELRLETDNNVV